LGYTEQTVPMHSVVPKDKPDNVPPDHHDENYDSYVIDHLLPIEVFVGEVYESKTPNDHFYAEDSV
jgi:hypothetical protein